MATLISENWTHQQLDNALESTNPLPTIDALNAHFDFGRALPAAGNTSGNQSDLFTTSDITAAPNDFAGASCSPWVATAASTSMTPRWQPAVSPIRPTGPPRSPMPVLYGLETPATATATPPASPTRRALMANFADNLDGSSEVGTALVDAKQTYAADNAVLSPYDLKSVMEATLYGLPMYRLNSDPPSAPTPPTPPTTSIDPVTGLATATVNAGTTASPLAFESVNAANGTYFQVAGSGQLQSTEYRPIEPLTDTEITEPGSGGGLAEVAHGALVTALTSNDQSLPNPAISSPGVDDSSNTSVTTASDPFPTSPGCGWPPTPTPEHQGRPRHQQLDVVDGQYLPGPNPSAGAQQDSSRPSAQRSSTPRRTTPITPRRPSPGPGAHRPVERPSSR